MSVAVIARDDFEPTEKGYIAFRVSHTKPPVLLLRSCIQKGEQIEVVEQHLSGWWRGKNSEGSEGFFPSTYVASKKGKKKKNELDEVEDDWIEGHESDGHDEVIWTSSPRQAPPVAPRRKDLKGLNGSGGDRLKNSDPSNPVRMSKGSRLRRLNGLKDMPSDIIEQTGWLTRSLVFSFNSMIHFYILTLGPKSQQSPSTKDVGRRTPDY